MQIFICYVRCLPFIHLFAKSCSSCEIEIIILFITENTKLVRINLRYRYTTCSSFPHSDSNCDFTSFPRIYTERSFYLNFIFRVHCSKRAGLHRSLIVRRRGNCITCLHLACSNCANHWNYWNRTNLMRETARESAGSIGCG